MRHATSLLLGTVLTLSAGVPAMSADDPEYRERERIVKNFSLDPGSRIEISMIAGPVEIDTTSGHSADTGSSSDVATTYVHHSPAPSGRTTYSGSATPPHGLTTVTMAGPYDCVPV